MRPELLIDRLRALKDEGADGLALRRDAEKAVSWKSRVRATVAAAVGEKHDLVAKLDANRYSPLVSTSSSSESYYARSYVAGVERARGYIEAAIYAVELLQGDDNPVDQRSFDPDLWEHVRGLVEAEDWGKVASQAAIFTESKVRTWAELDGDKVGKNMYATALANDAQLRLGSRPGEWEGWRMLGMGFAQATGNVDRHHIHDRPDARRYAIGVLGLASLLLTQLRYQHGDLVNDV